MNLSTLQLLPLDELLVVHAWPTLGDNLFEGATLAVLAFEGLFQNDTDAVRHLNVLHVEVEIIRVDWLRHAVLRIPPRMRLPMEWLARNGLWLGMTAAWQYLAASRVWSAALPQALQLIGVHGRRCKVVMFSLRWRLHDWGGKRLIVGYVR